MRTIYGIGHRHVGPNVSVGRGGRYQGSSDARAAQFRAQHLVHRAQSKLGGGVGRVARKNRSVCDRSNCYNVSATSLLHLAEKRAHEKERRDEISIERV